MDIADWELLLLQRAPLLCGYVCVDIRKNIRLHTQGSRPTEAGLHYERHGVCGCNNHHPNYILHPVNGPMVNSGQPPPIG